MQSDELHVLFVEDEPSIRTIIEMSLQLDPGIRLVTFVTPEDALAAIDAGDYQPDLALLNYWLPGATGIEVMDQLRSRPGLAALPTIFITARVRADDLGEYTRAGATGTISKPFDPVGLARTIREILATIQPAGKDGA